MPALRFPLRPLLMAGSVALLAACGGGDAPPDFNFTSNATTGVLTDSPIGGVQYFTGSGIVGFTDSQGRFKYEPGDQVVFAIGDLVLGPIVASGTSATVTPLDIVASMSASLTPTQQANMVTNLLILFQSLDSNGNPDDGIIIPTAARSELSGAVADTMLEALQDETPADFANPSVNVTLSALLVEVGLDPTPVSPAEALAHFKAEFLGSLAGVYSLKTDSTQLVFRFDGQGGYIMGEVSPADAAGEPGIERGQIDWNPATGELTVPTTPAPDTNGEWGLSHNIGERIYLSLDGTALVFHITYDDASPDEEVRLTRLDTPANSLAGPWSLNSTTLDTQQFIFLPNNKYLMIDPVGDAGCGDLGLEYGSYSVSGNVLTASNVTVDTNLCAGLHDTTNPSVPYSSIPIAFSSDGTVTLDSTETLYRAD